MNGLERRQAQGFLEDWADAQTGAAFRSSRPIGGISEEKLMKIIYTDVLVIGGGLAGPVSYTHLTLPTILLV